MWANGEVLLINQAHGSAQEYTKSSSETYVGAN